MIDWLSCRVPLTWEVPINGGNVTSVREDGVVDWSVDKRKALVGSYQSSLMVRTVELGFMEVSGNPAKFLQGHNLFGTDDVLGLFLGMMEAVCASVELVPTLEDRAAWLRGEVDISRIDLTTMYELDTRQDVREWLDAAASVANVKWRGRGHYQPGTLTFGKAAAGKRAKRWQLVLYCKGDEISLPGHYLHPDLPERERLYDWADNKLRTELRLRTGELQRLNLQKIGQWTAGQVAIVLETYLAKIEMSNAQMTHVDFESNPELKQRHLTALALWKTGIDCKNHYKKRTTFYRIRKEIIELVGVDISHVVSTSNVIPLRRVLEARPASVPTWAAGLMFEPPARLRAVA